MSSSSEIPYSTSTIFEAGVGTEERPVFTKTPLVLSKNDFNEKGPMNHSESGSSTLYQITE